ncbi:hypothetical protein ACFLT9_03565 [Acidobacteriota bacterium]
MQCNLCGRVIQDLEHQHFWYRCSDCKSIYCDRCLHGVNPESPCYGTKQNIKELAHNKSCITCSGELQKIPKKEK